MIIESPSPKDLFCHFRLLIDFDFSLKKTIWNFHICAVVAVDVHFRMNNTSTNGRPLNAKNVYSKGDSIWCPHSNDVIMGAMASQITSLTIVCSIIYLGADRRKHQSSASLAFVRGIHRSPVNSPHKWPVTRKMFPFDDVIMSSEYLIEQK